jgi:hypothetical protein
VTLIRTKRLALAAIAAIRIRIIFFMDREQCNIDHHRTMFSRKQARGRLPALPRENMVLSKLQNPSLQIGRLDGLWGWR